MLQLYFKREIYLFVIAGQTLVVTFWRLLQSLVFRRLPHCGAATPGRYLPGATCPQSPRRSSPKATHALSQSVSRSVGSLQGPRCHSQDECCILHRTALHNLTQLGTICLIIHLTTLLLFGGHLHCLRHLGWVSIRCKWPDKEFHIFTQSVKTQVLILMETVSILEMNSSGSLQTIILSAEWKQSQFLHCCVQVGSVPLWGKYRRKSTC